MIRFIFSMASLNIDKTEVYFTSLKNDLYWFTIFPKLNTDLSASFDEITNLIEALVPQHSSCL
ncbi:hypothetical protein CS542_09795 [Pedobacter sp. IW39]|nr:hypothetical protein CS542_09795 [Pedobacter sp. IW39]